jgi:hypothetical protein
VIKALEDAFKEAELLSEDEQDALASAIRAEIAAEGEWQRLLEGSQNALQRMSDQALAEHKAGRTRPLIPDDL